MNLEVWDGKLPVSIQDQTQQTPAAPRQVEEKQAGIFPIQIRVQIQVQITLSISVGKLFHYSCSM